MINKWLKEGTPSPFSTVRHVMHTATHFAMAEERLPTFSMSHDGSECSVFGRSCKLSSIAEGYKKALGHLKELIGKQLEDIGQGPIDKALATKWDDSLTNSTDGYGFLQNPQAHAFGSLGLLAKASTKGWILPVGGEPDGVPWNPRLVRIFMKKQDEIDELTAVLAHLSQGQARAPEFGSMTYANMGDSHRSLFMHTGGDLMSIIGYSKVGTKPMLLIHLIQIFYLALVFLLLFLLHASTGRFCYNPNKDNVLILSYHIFIIYLSNPTHTLY